MPRLISLHLDPELQCRLAAAIERMQEQTPGLLIRPGTAVKALLRRALEADERAVSGTKAKRGGGAR